MGRTLGIVSTGNDLEKHLKVSGDKSGSFEGVKIFRFNEKDADEKDVPMPTNLTDCIVHLCDLESAEKVDPKLLAKFRDANPECRIVGYSGSTRLRDKYTSLAEVYEPMVAYRLLEEGLPQRI